MRIAIDARELAGRPTGVGRYLAELLHQWAADPDARRHTFLLYAPEPVAGMPFEVRTVPGGRGTWWEQVWLPAALDRDRPDVLFAPAYTAPLRARVPIALMIHDLSFLSHPEWFRWREGLRRRWVTRHAARAAQIILTPSQWSKREVIDLLAVPEWRVAAVPHGLSPIEPSGSPADREAPSPREHLVLFAGSIFNRRHVPELIRAFAQVARGRRGVELAIVGENRSHPRQDLGAVAAAEGVGEQVSLQEYVPDATLAGLYARALVFAFLSEYEGFGLPPLEALAAGVPILVGDTPVAREVYGDAAMFVPPMDVTAAADALRRLLFDEEARAALLRRAPAVLARYRWDRAARDTLAAILRATT